MAHWLVKEEPTHYSFHDLQRDGSTEWSGVRNALAQRHLKSMRPGDVGFFYHSGAERSIVGTFRVVSTPEPDPEEPGGRYRVRIAAERALEHRVTLAAIKADPVFRQFALVRISRLSVMPVEARQWTRILKLARPGPRNQTSERSTRATRGPARRRKAPGR